VKWFVTDVSELPTGPTFKRQDDICYVLKKKGPAHIKIQSFLTPHQAQNEILSHTTNDNLLANSHCQAALLFNFNARREVRACHYI
jgi:hypothetical protein